MSVHLGLFRALGMLAGYRSRLWEGVLLLANDVVLVEASALGHELAPVAGTRERVTVEPHPVAARGADLGLEQLRLPTVRLCHGTHDGQP